MHRLYLFKAGLLIFGAGLVTLGVVIILQGEVVLEIAAVFGGVVLILHGVQQFAHMALRYSPFFGKKNPRITQRFIPTLIAGAFNIALGVLSLALPNLTIRVLILLFAFYVLLNATVKYIDFYIARRNGSVRQYAHLTGALFFTVFGILTVITENFGENALLIVSGVYLILYGLCHLNDFLIQIFPQRGLGLRRNIRISFPVFISAFMPYLFTSSFNRYLITHGSEEGIPSQKRFMMSQGERPPEVELLLHISNKGLGRMGHCDLAIDGYIYSFGNYDVDSTKYWRLFGDGVLFITKHRDKYIRHAVEKENRTVISYGLRLSEVQVNRVRQELARLLELTHPWEPPDTMGLVKYGNRPQGHERRSKRRLKAQTRLAAWKNADCKCYKFTEGRFRSYFILSTNCVMLADSVLGKAGTDIIKINGIITPGSFFSYLNSQFFLAEGIVSSRVIHSYAVQSITTESEPTGPETELQHIL